MREIIKEQLDKVEYTKLPSYNINTTHLVIPRSDSNPTVFDINKCYIIKINATLLNNDDSEFHTSWNRGIPPYLDTMKVQVVNKMGTMIKVFGFGHNLELDQDYSRIWEGWLPTNSLTIVKKL